MLPSDSKMLIAIYSNTGEWGGVDVLIGRFAAHLSLRGIEFVIIEPRGGRLRKELPNGKFVDPDQLQSIASLVTHVFVPSVSKLRIPLFPWEALAHAKVLTWVVHPNDVFRSFFPYSTILMDVLGYRVVRPLRYLLRSHAKLFDALFEQLIRQRALIVMDGATRRSLHYFLPTLGADPEVIPIPSPPTAEVAAGDQDHARLSIGYLGRMDIMKWSALRPFVLHELVPLLKHRKIALHVVSEGRLLPRLERLCLNRGIEFHCYGYLPNSQAREVIFTKTDLAIAMGTSALDIAGAGHPCILIDPNLGFLSRRQKYFRFVHEIVDYTLGEFRDFPGYMPGQHKFEDMIDRGLLDSAKTKGFEYLRRAHDPTRCFDELLSRIFGSGLTVGELGAGVRALIASFDEAKSNPLRQLSSFWGWKVD